MQTVSLSWQHSGELAAALTVTGGAMALATDRRVRSVGGFLREVAVIAALYGMWQLAGRVSISGTSGAFERAHWIRHFETYLPLPTERSVQQAVLSHPLVVQGANLYYASMHMTTMGLFLLWLFLRHRDRYRPVRQVLAWTTLGCLLIQLMPVAPPRMTGGIVDTGLVYRESVYSNGWVADQLSATPSVHVAWAVLVGYYTWRVGSSRWRLVGPLHAVVTVLVVVVTGNHWWLDGIVAVSVLVLCAWGVSGVRAGWRHAVAGGRAPRGPIRPAPEPVTSAAAAD